MILTYMRQKVKQKNRQNSLARFMMAQAIITLVVAYIPLSEIFALSTGNNFQKFSPSSSGVDFISTESSYPTKTGTITLGTTIDYGMYVQPVIKQDGIKYERSQDTLFSTHHHASIGFSKDVEFSLNIPFVIFGESLDHNSDKGLITKAGPTFVSGAAKYRFFRRSYYEMAIGAGLGLDFMESNPYTGSNKMLPFGSSIYLAATADYSPIIFGMNLGYRFRVVGAPIKNPHAQENTTMIPTVPHTLIFGAALAYNSEIFGNLIGEVYGSHGFFPVNKNQSDRNNTSIEYLLGFVKIFKNGFGMKVGAGSELFFGIGTAQLRIVAGLDYAFDAEKAGLFSPPKRVPKSQDERFMQMPDDPFAEEEEESLYPEFTEEDL
ncbi:MAG: hypothetical protein OXC40_05380 [Proteobacteria bacterium]|nr:hypothetical protein [Pseudomonadota bacterium]